ncbi:hypothetical protein ACFLW4_02155 [Chloroflexota bacterium]
MGGIALDGFGLGLLLGFVAGMGTGISIGKKQKPWSELSEGERKVRIGIITGLSVLAVAGVVVFLIQLLS